MPARSPLAVTASAPAEPAFRASFGLGGRSSVAEVVWYMDDRFGAIDRVVLVEPIGGPLVLSSLSDGEAGATDIEDARTDCGGLGNRNRVETGRCGAGDHDHPIVLVDLDLKPDRFVVVAEVVGLGIHCERDARGESGNLAELQFAELGLGGSWRQLIARREIALRLRCGLRVYLGLSFRLYWFFGLCWFFGLGNHLDDWLDDGRVRWRHRRRERREIQFRLLRRFGCVAVGRVLVDRCRRRVFIGVLLAGATQQARLGRGDNGTARI